MPRTVDHEERRSKILEAFMAVAAREGLHATSLRAVAVEAGISLRSVQYYFDTKVGLMQAGLAALENQSNERLRTRLGGLESSSSARARLQALFAIALPTDLESRRFHLLWTSYAMLAMTDQVISDRAFVDSPNRLTVTGPEKSAPASVSISAAGPRPALAVEPRRPTTLR